MNRTTQTQTPLREIDRSALRPKVTETLLAEMTQRIVKAFHPDKVILFGSYAYGVPHTDSDVDILVIMASEETMTQRIIRVKDVAKVRFLPMDMLVYTPAEIEQRLAIGDFFIREVLEKGKVLYTRDTA
jgi:predicted nucleotidyltransferase